MDHERDPIIRELLCDLGWLPSDLDCEEKRRLAERYLDATTAWFDAGRGLRQTMLERLRQAHQGLQKGIFRTGEYDAMVATLDEARLRAARARQALEAHIAAHNG